MLTIGMLALFSAGLVDGGWVLTCGEVNGGCFFGERLLVREIVSHSDAKEACKQQGSSLVAIKTALQQVDLVRQVLWDHPASSENTWAALFDPGKSDACPLIWTSLALNTAASSNTTDWEWAAGGGAGQGGARGGVAGRGRGQHLPRTVPTRLLILPLLLLPPTP